MSLQNIPTQERPRERLIQCGVRALSLTELIAILLTTGTKGRSVLDVAHDLVTHFGGLEGLLEASLEELMDIRGVGRAKAIQLKAAFGIALKSCEVSLPALGKVWGKEAYELVKKDLAQEKQEILMVILKDVKGRLISYEKVSVGTLSEVLVHPREVFYPAVRHKASSLILAHNHPSGDPTPSMADLELTRHLLRSSKVMGINLDDHIIVGKYSFISLKESGLLG
jgi:DNA repair protein RadC